MGNPDLVELASIFKDKGGPGAFVGIQAWTLDEVIFRRMVAMVLNKPLWWIHILDTEVVQEWRSILAGEEGPPNKVALVVEEVIAFVSQLGSRGVHSASTGATVMPGPAVGTIVSPDAVPLDLSNRLIEHTRVLEDIPEAHKDWQAEHSKAAGSNSNETISHSRHVLNLVNPHLFSLWYHHTLIKLTERKMLERMLPSEVVVDSEGKASITSYINNLHPIQHQAIHQDIADILSCVIPLFERQLSLLMGRLVAPILKIPILNEDLFEEGTVGCTALHISGSTPHEQSNVSPVRYRQLSPDTITVPILELRAGACVPFDYTLAGEDMQNQMDYILREYGISAGNKLTQEVGNIKLNLGRCVTYPNLFQHRLAPIRLLDASLVSKTIVSTSATPPQQIGWFTDAISSSACIPRLPNEIIRNVASFIPGLSTAADARTRYAQAIYEQTHSIGPAISDDVFERVFDIMDPSGYDSDHDPDDLDN
ncbi:hypothetical protein BSLG_008107 [Batrachochytrium salamandrivorans]|nr:hypothetical protein BSLG_008107 [Batrachochytrium salamandrivorans]